jgi:DNA polymerase III epsilon subunit-like protein
MTVYLDTETTGLSPSLDEILEIAIINDYGQPLLNTLVKPVKLTQWGEAETIHGISPHMVADAPTLEQLAPRIRTAVSGQDVVIYNAAFDAGFLGDLLSNAKSIHCCMNAWSEHVGEWSDYHGNYRWHKLTDAASSIRHQWSDSAHRALADTLACRSVWLYLHDPAERRRVDELIRQQHLQWQA